MSESSAVVVTFEVAWATLAPAATRPTARPLALAYCDVALVAVRARVSPDLSALPAARVLALEALSACASVAVRPTMAPDEPDALAQTTGVVVTGARAAARVILPPASIRLPSRTFVA